jgi:hypothetical protein
MNDDVDLTYAHIAVSSSRDVNNELYVVSSVSHHNKLKRGANS